MMQNEAPLYTVMLRSEESYKKISITVTRNSREPKLNSPMSGGTCTDLIECPDPEPAKYSQCRKIIGVPRIKSFKM